MTNTPAVSVENCDDGWVTIQSEVPNEQYRLALWAFGDQQTTMFKAGQLFGTSCGGWKDDSCVSTRQNETHWTMPGHARRSVWRLSRLPGEKDPENGRATVSAKKQNNGLWKRMPCTKSRLHDQFSRQKIHSKEVRSARNDSKASSHVQISCARSTHEDEGYLQTVTSKRTDLVVRIDRTDGTTDADLGFSSDMMAKPQSVVKLRRFGALFNAVVQRFRDCITRSQRC